MFKKKSKPIKTMFIKKHIANSKSNSPTLNCSLNRNSLSKVPNLCYINKMKISYSKESPNQKSLEAPKTSKNSYIRKKLDSKCFSNSPDTVNILKLVKNNIKKKFKIIDKNYFIYEGTTKKYFFDKIFNSDSKDTELFFEYFKATHLKSIVLSSSSFEFVKLLEDEECAVLFDKYLEAFSCNLSILSIKKDQNKLDIKIVLALREENNYKIITEDNQPKYCELSSISKIKEFIDFEKFQSDLIEDKNLVYCIKLSSKNENSLALFLNNKEDLEERNQYIISIISLEPSKKYFEGVITVYNIFTEPNESCVYQSSISKKQTVNKKQLNNSATNSISPKNHKSISPSSNDLVAALTEENKKLQRENKGLHSQIAKLKEDINSLKALLKEKPNEILQKENDYYLNINKELNEELNSKIEKFDKFNKYLYGIDNKVYTFDDESSIISQTSKITGESFANFKKKFNTYFTDISTQRNLVLTCSEVYYDSLKSTMNNFYMFMNELCDNILRSIQENTQSALVGNLIEVSFINTYYENIIFELLNHSLYQNKRLMLSNYICEKLCENNEKEINKKLNEFDKEIKDFIENSNSEMFNEIEKFNRILSCVSTREELENSMSKFTKNDYLTIMGKKSTKKKEEEQKYSFYGYIKKEQSPEMLFDDEDSQNI